MCFTGNPGTGKTMIARMFGNILFRAGLLTSNKFIEVDRTDLVGKYIAIKKHASPSIRNIPCLIK